MSLAVAGAYEDFFKAVEFDDAASVSRLLGRGFDPNTLSESGQLPLFLALREGSYKVATALVAHPEIRIDKANAVGETPLMVTAMKGSMEWTQRLVERGALVDRDGWTPLQYAATGPDPAIAGFLLDRGARIDALSPRGTTALMLAARYGDERTVALLLERGADAKLRDPRGMSASDFARGGGREPLAQRLDQAASR
jgi:hypothetical protein